MSNRHEMYRRRRRRKALLSTDACRYCDKPPDIESGDEWVWMCPECDEIRQYLLEKHPGLGKGAVNSRLVRIVKVRGKIEDLEWMLDAGETDALVLARRLEYTDITGLDKLLRPEREDRPDLEARISW